MCELTIGMVAHASHSYTFSVAFGSVMLALMGIVTVGYLAGAIVLSRRKAPSQAVQDRAQSYLARMANLPSGDAVDPASVHDLAQQRSLSSAYIALGGGLGSLAGAIVVIPLFVALVTGYVAPFIFAGMFMLAPWMVCVFWGLGIATYALSRRFARQVGPTTARHEPVEPATRLGFAQQGGINVLIACGTIVAVSALTLGATLLFLPGGQSVSQGNNSGAPSQPWLLWFMPICAALLVASSEVLALSTRRLTDATYALTPQLGPMTLRQQLASLRAQRFSAANIVCVFLTAHLQLLPTRDTAVGYVVLGLYFAVVIGGMAANFIVFIRIGGLRTKNDVFF